MQQRWKKKSEKMQEKSMKIPIRIQAEDSKKNGLQILCFEVLTLRFYDSMRNFFGLVHPKKEEDLAV